MARLLERLGRRLQRLEDRHAGAGQHGQRAGEARRVVAARKPAHQGQLQPRRIETLARRRRCAAPGAWRLCRPPGAAAATQPQLRTKRADRQHGHGEKRQGAFAAGKDVRDLRHHVRHQEQHDGNRDDGDDRRIEGGAQQLGLQGLALFEVVGQPLQHQPQVAALLAGPDHRGVDLRELAREAGQRLAKRRAGVDLGAQRGHQMALALVFGFVGQGREGALQRQARGDQAGQLAGPDRQARGGENAAVENAAAPARSSAHRPRRRRSPARPAAAPGTVRAARLRTALAVSASITPRRVSPSASRASNE